MKLICFEHNGTRSVGILEDNMVADIGELLRDIGDLEGTVDDLLPLIEINVAERLAHFDMRAVLETGRFVKDISQVRLCAPVKRPPKIVCVGRNYREHAEEVKASGADRDIFKDGAAVSEVPMLFAKAANSVIGPGEKIVIPEDSNELDYEVELGVVLGRPGFRLDREQVRDHIFGYTVLNDITARDLQRTEKQWYRAKGFATFCPIGPVIVTSDEIDPLDTALELTVNGELRQKSSTKHMITGVYDLVSIISHVTPVEPGDIIGTGTPAGVGGFRDPPVFLKSGDVIRATVEGIGTLENEVA
jgi:2-keto-4-pentenoate hydratase/2-oxohepta-3-ene-1,7-dioic acid hydratase in catechol pathway